MPTVRFEKGRVALLFGVDVKGNFKLPGRLLGQRNELPQLIQLDSVCAAFVLDAPVWSSPTRDGREAVSALLGRLHDWPLIEYARRQHRPPVNPVRWNE